MNAYWSIPLFWAAIAVCIVIALALVLPALMRTRAGVTSAGRPDLNIAVYRDQLNEIEADRDNGTLSSEQFESAKLELEARLAEDALATEETPEPISAGSRKLGYTLGAVIPAAALGLYFLLGAPGAVIAMADLQPGAADPSQAGEQVPGDHDIMTLIQQVEEKTKANPDDGEAWAILAKTYGAVEHWPEALNAYKKAIELLPQNASVMSGYAVALAIISNGVLAGEPKALVEKALEIDPEDIRALELAGIAAFQEQGYAKAAFYFKRLHKLLPPESPYAQDIQEARKEAERLMNYARTGLVDLSNQPPTEDENAARAARTVKGSIDIAPALKAELGDKDVLFLFARPAQGGEPIAAIRANPGAALPLEFELNDNMAMNPGNALSRHEQVVLVARVSKSGNPVAQPGDFEGVVKDVEVGAAGVKIVIDKTRP